MIVLNILLTVLPLILFCNCALSFLIVDSVMVLRYVKGRAVSGKDVVLLYRWLSRRPRRTVLGLELRSSEVQLAHHLRSLSHRALTLRQLQYMCLTVSISPQIWQEEVSPLFVLHLFGPIQKPL